MQDKQNIYDRENFIEKKRKQYMSGGYDSNKKFCFFNNDEKDLPDGQQDNHMPEKIERSPPMPRQ